MSYSVRKRVVTTEMALEKLQILCSRSEKCSGDARRLLYRWQIASNDADKIVESLKNDRFIDDSRYAAAYVREKSRFSGWGARKIEQSLIMKGVDNDIVREAINEVVSKDDMKAKLTALLLKKLKEVERKEDDSYKKKEKLFRFAASRGFDFDMITSVIESFEL